LRWVAAAVDLGLNALGAFFNPVQLVLPVSFEGFSELMQRANGRGVGAVEAVAAIATHADEVDTAQDAEVLGDRRLVKADGRNNFAYLVLIVRQIQENLPASRLGNGVEGIGGGCSPGHEENNTCSYGNMSSEKFVTFVFSRIGARFAACGHAIYYPSHEDLF
jgi:hypothetical protein